ncbi:uncharacterized protein B0I36DRAFT_411439 [Microdochium trichocladiopsis]|uniref:Uncharacterized protein n=1 Tax=Microdochium trichocladiopsis TaxID=1682393 RepID=A0A9P8Y7C6_9PEZI|nr:uncharacterized protein B0I36DRAFT_411439 [Microdochium trichocladiopsis]KAH7029496.1 hypothetical protein B0I36DRAFT_411439 [Microdochium trichocladiopsis]
MTRGTLVAKVVLADPKHVHCGPSDPVRGHVLVRYNPTASHVRDDDELQIPIKVTVTLQGRLKVKLVPRNERWDLDNVRFFRARVPLFSTQHPLPPSMHFIDPVLGVPGEMRVQYEAAARIEVLGDDDMNLVIEDQSEHGGHVLPSSEFRGTPVLYERPPVAAPVGGGGGGGGGGGSAMQSAFAWFMFKDKRLPLLDGTHGQLKANKKEKNRTGLRDRLMTFSQPLYVYDCHVSCPRDVHRFQPLVLQIRIVPSERKSTAGNVTQVRLELTRVTVQVVGYVQGRSQGGTLVRRSLEDEEIVAQETVNFTGEGASEATTPGGMARGRDGHEERPSSSISPTSLSLVSSCSSGAPMNADNDWTLVVAFASVLHSVTSSFKTVCIRRDYVFRVICKVRVGGKRDEMFERTFKVTVHPPLGSDVARLQGSSVQSGVSGIVVPSHPEGALHDTFGELDIGCSTRAETLPPYTP